MEPLLAEKIPIDESCASAAESMTPVGGCGIHDARCETRSVTFATQGAERCRVSGAVSSQYAHSDLLAGGYRSPLDRCDRQTGCFAAANASSGRLVNPYSAANRNSD